MEFVKPKHQRSDALHIPKKQKTDGANLMLKLLSVRHSERHIMYNLSKNNLKLIEKSIEVATDSETTSKRLPKLRSGFRGKSQQDFLHLKKPRYSLSPSHQVSHHLSFGISSNDHLESTKYKTNGTVFPTRVSSHIKKKFDKFKLFPKEVNKERSLSIRRYFLNDLSKNLGKHNKLSLVEDESASEIDDFSDNFIFKHIYN